MKVLILNGSPRPDGDTAYILEMLKGRFPRGTGFETIHTFEADIRPCTDCRYCWKNEGCCIRDEMDTLWKDDYDVLVMASPLYMSFVTPPLFSVISRLNAVWSNRYFLKKPCALKPKKGTVFGYNFVAPDADFKGIDYWMGITYGICGGKNPSCFKKFMLR